MPPIRILLADDHTMVRDGLRALLDRQQDLIIVAEAADGRECIQHAEEHSPDVVMMDIAMPKMNGIEATRRILAANPSTGVVILSMHQDESYVLQSLKAGAKGLSAEGFPAGGYSRGDPLGGEWPGVPQPESEPHAAGGSHRATAIEGPGRHALSCLRTGRERFCSYSRRAGRIRKWPAFSISAPPPLRRIAAIY